MNFNKKVKKGAELLDGLFDRWETHINVSKLDVGNLKNCILGQLFGRKTSWKMFGLWNSEFHAKYGFYADGQGTDKLTETWKKAIEARL